MTPLSSADPWGCFTNRRRNCYSPHRCFLHEISSYVIFRWNIHGSAQLLWLPHRRDLTLLVTLHIRQTIGRQLPLFWVFCFSVWYYYVEWLPESARQNGRSNRAPGTGMSQPRHRIRASAVGDEQSSKELFEQLVNSYSEHFHMSPWHGSASACVT